MIYKHNYCSRKRSYLHTYTWEDNLEKDNSVREMKNMTNLVWVPVDLAVVAGVTHPVPVRVDLVRVLHQFTVVVLVQNSWNKTAQVNYEVKSQAKAQV